MTWQSVVPSRRKCYHQSMKRIRSRSTFNYITLCVCVTLTFDLFFPKLCDVTRTTCSTYMPYFEVYRPLCFFLNIRSYISDFVAPLLGNRCCYGNHFVPHLLGGRHHVSPQVWTWWEYSVLSYCNFYPDTWRDVVTLTFNLWPWSCDTWCHLSVQSNWIRRTVPELGRPPALKSQFLRFLG